MWNLTATLSHNTPGVYPSFTVNTSHTGTNGPWTNALIIVSIQTMSTTTSVSDTVFGSYTKVASILQPDGNGEHSVWINSPTNYSAWNGFTLTANVTTGTNPGSPSTTSRTQAIASVLIPSDTYTASGTVSDFTAITGVGNSQASGLDTLIESTVTAPSGTQMFWAIGSLHTSAQGGAGFLGSRTPRYGSGGDVGVVVPSYILSISTANNITDTAIWAPITPWGAGTRTLDYNVTFNKPTDVFIPNTWQWTAIAVSFTYPGSAPIITQNRVTNFVTNYYHYNTAHNAIVNTTTRTCPPFEFVNGLPDQNIYSPMAPIKAGDTILCCIGNTTNVVPTNVSDNVNGTYTLVTSLSNTNFFLGSIFIYRFASSAAIQNPGRDWILTASAGSTTDWSITTTVLSPGAELDQLSQQQAVVTFNRDSITTNMTPAVFTSNPNEWFLSLFVSQDNFNGAFGGSPIRTLTGLPQYYYGNVGRLLYGVATNVTTLPGLIIPSSTSIPSGIIDDGTPAGTGGGGVQGQFGYVWIESTWKAIGAPAAALPLATPKYFTTFKNTPLIVYPTGLLNGNLGTGLTVTGHTNPSHGTLSLFGTDGTLTYTPTTDYVGLDVHNYTITDSFGQTSTSTANYNVVNDVLGVVKVQRKMYNK